jgi:hypothetical protein
MIYIYDETTEIAVHALVFGHCVFVTNIKHYPDQKLSESNYSIRQQCHKAQQVGPYTELLVKKVFEIARSHPLRNLSKVQGILSLGQTYGNEKLEYAAQSALELNKYSYVFIKNCAKNYQPAKPTQTLLPARQREFVCLQGGLL